jgi:hypothetical protein
VETRTRSGVLIIRSESLSSLAQGGFSQVKIMLTTSSLDKKMKSGRVKNQVDKLKIVLKCFSSIVSIGLSYYEEGCNIMSMT